MVRGSLQRICSGEIGEFLYLALNAKQLGQPTVSSTAVKPSRSQFRAREMRRFPMPIIQTRRRLGGRVIWFGATAVALLMR